MSVLVYILIFNFIGSIISLAGGIFLLFKEKVALKVSHLIAAFAAGALLATAFFDLLPEAQKEAGKSVDIFLWTLIGFLFFFLTERFVHWFHSHGHTHKEKDIKPTVLLIVFGDTIHNFIDGIAIASAFLTNIPLGIITTFAVGAHEIPQEIGDFGLLLHKGVKRSRILWINFFSALASLLGALLAYFMGNAVQGIVPIFLSITAGFFIYIAAADLIPEIHHENRKGFAFYESLLLIVGALMIWITIQLLSNFNT
ncbi:MAG: hypothetical protein A3C27_02725 [Candidatus Levybacteria bacterium RIFCSPHIGHO2_02_FULL_39_36]|nr:MAG: Zinc transporter, ZIP family [Candidatus Levybacteria bacterium GW2011_GWA1_39_11]KKR24701.1 MAG: Zinc transporter, ZIP family [Candidatus Levybacteria bacterium GW2011_GWB1_39_7]KKR49530.1 MAG: Zinc transporter, ZIP family [Candidatus Levybacteria bacterium GW2011_GWA2_40_16]OGH15399.1 MAG: hypothetical protein A2689_02430 [Candidatus Levybacteria bacterium RIFCSPHIGHO2_01_FULL_38_96]OGH26036.1 MAG: hypothetical protein A3E68_01890 [Candidatus Levybacteria bacterium RIFCSPHIGHO2_12_FUL